MGHSTQALGNTGEPWDSSTGVLNLRARVYMPSPGRFLQADPLRKSGPGVGGWNRYSYAGNNPTSAVDPSGLLTYFIGGVGSTERDPAYAAFVDALRRLAVPNVKEPVPAFTGQHALDLSYVLRVAGDIRADIYAQNLKSMILRDQLTMAPGEQLNIIAYSGGAQIASNTARLLRRSDVTITSLVTIGGVTLTPVQNVGAWTRFIGTLDVVAGDLVGSPGRTAWLWGLGHTDYFQPETIDEVASLVVRDAGIATDSAP